MPKNQTLVERLTDIKDTWIEMGDKFSDKKQNYSADAYKDCADNIEHLIVEIKKQPALVDKADVEWIVR